MAIELKHIRNDKLNGGVMGSVFVDGVFVCHEFGSDVDELWSTFRVSQDIYPVTKLDDFEKDCI